MLASVALSACSYDLRGLCIDDVCLGNQAPVAVISGAGSGTLRVGASGVARLDASTSYDPDGDVLTFVWTTDCTGTASADAASYALAEVSGPCTVTLAVTDPHGASDTAHVELDVVDVDAYVSSRVACVATYDGQSGGTTAQPFCTIEPALLAFADVLTDAVKLDAQTHSLAAATTLSSDTTLLGGYDSQNAWARGGTSDIAVTVDPVATLGFVVRDGAHVVLEDLGLYFADACATDCALLTANDSQLETTNVTFGANSLADQPIPANSAAGYEFYAIAMTASAEGSASLSMTNGEVHLPSDAGFAYGISVAGPADVTVSGVTFNASGAGAAGISTQNADVVTIEDCTFDMTGNATTSIVAVADGQQNDLTGTEVCGATSAVCNPSRELHVRGGTITVGDAVQGAGIAALGTQVVTVDTVQIEVGAVTAIGVITTAADSVTLTNVTATAEATAAGSFAVGYSDNYAGDDVLDAQAGSKLVTVQGGTFTATTTVSNVVELCGVSLAGTTEAHLDDMFARAVGTMACDHAIAVHTTGVTTLTSERAQLGVSSTVASGAVGWLDGTFADASLGTEEVPGATTLRMTAPVAIVVGYSSNPYALVSGFGFAASTDVVVSGGSAAVTGNGPYLVYGGVSLDVAESLTYEGVSFIVTRQQLNPEAVTRGALGLHDGDPATYAGAALSFTALRNTFVLNSMDGAAGVVIEGSGSATPIIANNAVYTGPTVRLAVGSLFRRGGGMVAFNTFRLTCAETQSCVGVYLATPDNVIPVDVIANTLTVTTEAAPPSTYATLVAETRTGGSTVAVNSIAWNLYHCDAARALGDSGEISLYRSGAGTLENLPDASTLSASDPNATKPGTAFNNDGINPALFCDTTHAWGAPLGPQAGFVTSAVATYGADFEGESRSGPPYDAGADAIAASCP